MIAVPVSLTYLHLRTLVNSYKRADACRMHTLYFRSSYRGSGDTVRDGAVNQRR